LFAGELPPASKRLLRDASFPFVGLWISRLILAVW